MGRRFLAVLGLLCSLVGSLRADELSLAPTLTDGGVTGGQATFNGPGFPPSMQSAPVNWGFYAQFTDGWPGAASPSFTTHGVSTLAQSGGWPGAYPNYYHDINIVDSAKTFGPADALFYFRLSFLGEDAASYNVLGGRAPRSVGVTIIDVEQVSPTDPSKFVDVPGATVTMRERDYGQNYAASVPVIERKISNRNRTFVLFGYTPGKPTDHEYPSGMQGDFFIVEVSAPGFKPAQVSAGSGLVRQGALWLGEAAIAVLQPIGSNSPSTMTLGTGGDAGEGLNTTNPPAGGGAATGTGTGTGTGGGGADGAAWYDSFWEKFKAAMAEVFVPKQADIDGLKTARDALLAWGPFSLLSQLKREFDWAFGGNGQSAMSDDDPNYWTVNPSAMLTSALEDAKPIGYNHPGRGEEVHTGAYWDNFALSSLNFAPYQRFIVLGRGICTVMLWVFFAIGLLRRFTPDLKV